MAIQYYPDSSAVNVWRNNARIYRAEIAKRQQTIEEEARAAAAEGERARTETFAAAEQQFNTAREQLKAEKFETAEQELNTVRKQLREEALARAEEAAHSQPGEVTISPQESSACLFNGQPGCPTMPNGQPLDSLKLNSNSEALKAMAAKIATNEKLVGDTEFITNFNWYRHFDALTVEEKSKLTGIQQQIDTGKGDVAVLKAYKGTLENEVSSLEQLEATFLKAMENRAEKVAAGTPWKEALGTTNQVSPTKTQQPPETSEPKQTTAQSGVTNANEPPSPFKASGHGLIGGVGWEAFAFNVPIGLSSEREQEVRKEADKRLQAAMDRVDRDAGLKRRRRIDTKEYNFILGVALSSSPAIDIASRALWDNLSKGRATPLLQQSYDLLRGRSFEPLDCHSNGAMICLAALSTGVSAARHVRLFGPQLTEGSLADWQNLLQSGKIGSLEIYISQGDPVPPVSYAAKYLVPGLRTAETAYRTSIQFASELLGDPNTLEQSIVKLAPSIQFRRVSCPQLSYQLFSVKCHEMAHYQSRVHGEPETN